MAKTACEEAADILETAIDYKGNVVAAGQQEQCENLAKRLRAEGRELRRLRKSVVDYVKSPTTGAANIIYTYLEHEAARIQKARNKK